MQYTKSSQTAVTILEWEDSTPPLLKLVISGIKGEPTVRLEDSFFADAAGKDRAGRMSYSKGDTGWSGSVNSEERI